MVLASPPARSGTHRPGRRPSRRRLPVTPLPRRSGARLERLLRCALREGVAENTVKQADDYNRKLEEQMTTVHRLSRCPGQGSPVLGVERDEVLDHEHPVLADQLVVEVDLAPPYSGRWIITLSQWISERLPLSASS